MNIRKLLRRRLILLLLCSDPEIGGPAGTYRHHRRRCTAVRFARWTGLECPEDPQTGWVDLG